MPLPALRRFLFSSFLLASLLLLAGRACAELVWTPQSGWKVEGGVLATTPDGGTSYSAVGLMNKARAAEEKGHNGTAIKYYGRVAKRYANSIYAGEAQYRMGNLRFARQQYLKAFAAYQAVIVNYPNTTRFNEIIGKQYQIATILLDGGRGRIWGIFPGFTNREKAIGFMETVVVEAPYSDYAPLALMCAASGYEYMRESEEAIDALDRMINIYAQNTLLPDAYLKLAQSHSALVDGPHYDQGSTRDAITYFEDFMILFPSDNNVVTAEKGLTDMKVVLAESKIKMGDFYFHDRSNYKAARVFYNEAITVYPDSPVAARAKDLLAQVDVAAAKAAQAQAHPKKKHFFFF